jgi:hypothetical protein
METALPLVFSAGLADEDADFVTIRPHAVLESSRKSAASRLRYPGRLYGHATSTGVEQTLTASSANAVMCSGAQLRFLVRWRDSCLRSPHGCAGTP